ncbi:WXG100 family type VII secretion target [Nocardia sp. CA-107356]|uniref:WXG100 family type VII secretion target n=1 Tax=Nocardia sp. CA-107356 TaxID=3239972 RepID=UPI003D8C3968
MSSSKPISANFDGVADGARQIINRAETIRNELEAFEKKVKAFFDTQGGQAKDAFDQYQTTWNQHVVQLNTTLHGAAQLVDKGNSELQGTDTALAGLF